LVFLENIMKLTGRQQQFLSRFLDLYREARQPLHYSVVAQRLGVTPVTAYDMLRLLEERGWVTSEYTFPIPGSPGRSSIVFSPTAKAAALLAHLAGEDLDQQEWEEAKNRILQALKQGHYQDLLEELLLRIPERKTPMLYVTEMIVAMLLHLRQLSEGAKSSLGEEMRAMGLPGEIGFQALVGLAVGLSYVERANRRIASLLLAYTNKYQEYLARLTAENKARISAFVQEMAALLALQPAQGQPCGIVPIPQGQPAGQEDGRLPGRCVQPPQEVMG